jgi:acyl-coenzyme A synthetase/AMP-(fatty) acid ligase
VLAAGGSPLLVHAKTPAAELKRTAVRFGARLALVDDAGITGLDEEFGPVAVAHGAAEQDVQVATIDRETRGFDATGSAMAAVPMHPTSGTTGQAKVALRPGRCAIEEARHYIETIGITAADSILAAAPMSHAYAYGMCVMVPLLCGASVVSMRGFQAALVTRALTEQRVTVFPAVPAMLDVLLFSVGDRLRNSIGKVLSAGSPLTERTAMRFREKSGVTVRPLYGTTETGGITVAPPGDAPIVGNNVGPPMHGVEAQIREMPMENDLNPGIGRLHIRSSSMMAGYLGAGDIDTSMLEDGWFDTGDLAWIDGQGHIHLTGREADVINVEGLKVLPCEVEEVIAALPGVREVKVYAGRRKSGGQFIKAAVVADARLDAAAIRAHCERSLVYYKRPERIFPVEALPRSPPEKFCETNCRSRQTPTRDSPNSTRRAAAFQRRQPIPTDLLFQTEPDNCP